MLPSSGVGAQVLWKRAEYEPVLDTGEYAPPVAVVHDAVEP
jgi:hypothetical protein